MRLLGQNRTQSLMSGQNLAEFALPVAIIGCLLLVSLPFFIETFQKAAPRVFSGKGPIGNDNSLTTRPMGQNPALANVSLTLSNGKTITLDGVPDNLLLSVETIGSDGTTEKLAALMKRLADKLVKEGALSQAQADLLEDLANSGHKMAELQALIDQQVDLCRGDATCLMKAQFPVDGRILNYTDVAMLMGAGGEAVEVHIAHKYLAETGKSDQLVDTRALNVSSIPYFDNRPSDYMGRETKNMVENFLRLEASGGLKEPAVRALVERMTSQILNLSGISAYNGSQLANKVATGQAVSTNFLKSELYSQLSNNKSARICTSTDQNVDSGVQCY